jgi:ankyrin repeat protein
MKKFSLIILLLVGIANANTYENNFLNENTLENITINNVSPFCMSIIKGDFETAKKLIDMGADINAKSNGLTPVMYAAKYNRTDILELLIAKGADLKSKDTKKGYTALKFAELSNAREAKVILENALSA